MADAKLKYVIAAQDNASVSIQGVQRNFQRLDDQVQKSRVQMNQFGGSLVGTQRNLRKFALGGVQQAGYQVGDFAVQVANGTSKVQAFGQFSQTSSVKPMTLILRLNQAPMLHSFQNG